VSAEKEWTGFTGSTKPKSGSAVVNPVNPVYSAFNPVKV
jgi:hypothetical protein